MSPGLRAREVATVSSLLVRSVEAVPLVPVLLRRLEGVEVRPLVSLLPPLLDLLDSASVQLRVVILGGGALPRLETLPLEVPGPVSAPGPDLPLSPEQVPDVSPALGA